MCPTPNEHSRIASSVLDQINAKRIAMRSKFSVVAERFGIDGLALILFLVAVLAIALIVFWARSTQLLAALTFGTLGLRAVTEAFPYQWLTIALIAVLAIVGLLHSQLTDRPLANRLLIGGLATAAVLLGCGIAAAGAAERFLAVADRDDRVGQPARSVYALTEHHGPESLVGNVVETVPEGYIVQVGHQNVVVTVSQQTKGAATITVVPGDRILVVGSAGQQQTVRAAGIRRLPQLPVPHMNWVFHRFPAPVSS